MKTKTENENPSLMGTSFIGSPSLNLIGITYAVVGTIN